MRKLLRKIWNTWRMPNNGEYVHLKCSATGKYYGSVRVFKVTKMHKWDFPISMIQHESRWYKIKRSGMVGQPQLNITWSFADGV